MVENLAAGQEIDLSGEEEIQLPSLIQSGPTSSLERVDNIASLAAIADVKSVEPLGAMEEYTAGFTSYKDLIQKGGEDNIREYFNQKQKASLEESLKSYATDTLIDPSQDSVTRQDLVQSTLYALGENYSKTMYGLEHLAVQGIKNATVMEPNQLDYQERLLTDTVAAEIDDTIIRHATRSLIIAHEFDKITKEHEDQPAIQDMMDFFSRFVLTSVLTSSDDIVKGVGKYTNKAGLNVQNLSQELLFGMTDEEFDKEFPKVVENLREQSGWIGENLGLLRENFAVLAAGGTREGAQRLNEASAFDIIAGLPVVTIARTSIAGLSAILGNRMLARTVTAEALIKDSAVATHAAEGTVRSTEGIAASTAPTQAISDALPSTMVAEQNGIPRMAGLVSDTLDEVKGAASSIKAQLGDLGRMDGEEVARMFEAESAKIREAQGNRVLPFDLLPVRSEGLYLFDMAIGKANGGLFKDVAQAETAAKRLGFKEFTVDEIPGQGAFIKVRHNMKETPYYKSWADNEVTSKMPFLHFLRSPDSFNPKMITELAAQASMKKSKFFSDLRGIQKKFQGLPKAERQRLDEISVDGNVKNKWFTPQEFVTKYFDNYKTLPKDREIIAYYAQKEMHDLNHAVINWAEKTKLAGSGWKQGVIKGEAMSLPSQPIKQIDEIGNLRDTIIYHTGSNKVIFGEDIAPTALKELMDKEGLTLYKTLDDFDTPMGEAANHVLVKKGSVNAQELTNVVPYLAGGPRAYGATHFIRQFQDKMVTVNGKLRRIIKNPSTLVAGRSITELSEVAANLEKARLLFKEGKLTDAVVEANTPWKTVKEWDAALRRGEINADHPFVIVKDGEAPVAKANVLTEGGTYNISTETSGANMSGEASGRLLMSRRGKPLYGSDFAVAKIISPNEMIQNVTDNLLHTASFTDFKLSAINRWFKTYTPYINSRDMSPEQAFYRAEYTQGSNPAMINQAKASREAINRILSSSSSDSTLWKSAVSNLADWVDRKGLGETSSKILSMQSKDPFNALKGMAFDLKLGMFDPSQLIIQTQTIAAMAALHNPITAAKFAWEGGWIRAAHVNQGAEFLAYAAKKSGMNVDEFKLMAKEMQRGGYLDVNGEMILTDHHATAVYGAPGSAIRQVRNLARFPFYEAERLNRAYGYRMAWDDLTKKYTTPSELNRAFKNGDAQRMLAGKTNDYTMNMLSSSAAAYQKGALSVTTQFMSYQLRMLENIIPEAIGGSKRFTGMQKFRMAAGQMLLYGSAGIPGGAFLADQVMQATGAKFDHSLADQSLHRLIAGGVIDAALYAASTGEVDVAFSKRAATGAAVEQFIGDIFGWGMHQKSMADVLFGASFSVGGQVLSDAFGAVQLAALAASSEQVGIADVTPMIAQAMAENVSSLSRALKAYDVYRYGVNASQNTGKVTSFATPVESIAALFGIPLREIADMEHLSANVKHRKEFIKGHAEIIVKLRNEAMRALNEGDVDKFNLKLKISSAHLQLYDPEDRYAIIDAANKSKQFKTTVQGYRDQFLKTFPNRQLMDMK
jgi:hypothetical protein